MVNEPLCHHLVCFYPSKHFLSSTFTHKFLFLTILFHLILQRSIYMLLLRGVNKKYFIWSKMPSIIRHPIIFHAFKKQRKKIPCVLNYNILSVERWMPTTEILKYGPEMCILELMKECVNLILSHFTLSISTTEERNSLLSFEFCWREG